MKEKIIILIIIIAVVFGVVLITQEEKGYKEDIAREKLINLSLMQELIINGEERQRRQAVVDVIVMEEGWTLIHEKLNFEKTHHLNFPFTANRMNFFRPKDRDNDDRLIIRDQLFIFDSKKEDWISISVLQTLHRDGKTIIMEELDAIYEDNPWEIEEGLMESLFESLDLND